MTTILDVAKVTAKGQITIPADVRAALGVRNGDKVLFVRTDDGNISLKNSNLEAVRSAQQAFAGVAEEAGLKTEEDLVALIKEVRADRAQKG